MSSQCVCYHTLCPLEIPLSIHFLFDLQDYNLRDTESLRKVVQHSNLVINLVGRDYETR